MENAGNFEYYLENCFGAKTMKDQLSALIDSELDIESSEHLILSVKSSSDLKASWAQYHLIGDAMRGDMPLSYDFSERVMRALENEPTILAPNASKSVDTVGTVNDVAASSRFKSPKMWSIAASVAAVAMATAFLTHSEFGSNEIAPMEIAQELPAEYLAAHQSIVPSGAAYYIQTASYTEPQR